jgi:hypothetical protein
LRDGFVLGLAPDIEAEWEKFKEKDKDKVDEDNESDTSSGEGSVYDKSSEEEEMKKNAKRRRKNKSTKPLEKTKQRAKPNDLSGFILPKSGDKTVAGEAFQKLSSSQKKVVAENVNKKTKKVRLSINIYHTTIET